MTHSPRIFLTLLLISGWQCALAQGQATQPAASTFEVHEWAVFVLDASQNRLNPDGLITSSAPEFVDSRRQAGPEDAKNTPCPMGIIRLVGQPDSKVDVRLQIAEGKFLSSWPKAQTRAAQLLWRDLSLSQDPGSGSLEAVSPPHSFGALREGASDYLTPTEGSAERFLMFDVDVPYTCPVKVSIGDHSSMVVKNVSHTALRSARIYRPENGLWRETMLGDIAVVKNDETSATKPATSQPATLPTATAGPVTMPAATILATTIPSTGVSATGPATGASTPQPVESPAIRPADLVADWIPELKKASVCDSDIRLITGIIAAQACDARRLTVIYKMDDAEYDRLLPLEVVPEPSKIVRLGIVIIKNADPTMGTEMDDLIAQLGDPAWSKRQEATDALLKLGAAAIPKLQQASKSKDLEVVWRSERLLSELAKGPPQPNQGQ